MLNIHSLNDDYVIVAYWQSRQLGISVYRIHSCKQTDNQKTSNMWVLVDHVGWQVEEWLGVMKLYIHIPTGQAEG